MTLSYAEFMDAVRGGTVASSGITVTPQFADYLGQNPAYAQQLFHWWDGTGQAPVDLSGMSVPGSEPPTPTTALASSGGMPGFGAGQPGSVGTGSGYPTASQEYVPAGSSAPWAGPHGVSTRFAGGGRNPFSGMALGYGMAAVGLVITVVSFASAAQGGTYFVAWGLIVFGLIRGVTATIRYFRQR